MNHDRTILAMAAAFLVCAGCSGGADGSSSDTGGTEVGQDPPTTLTTAPDGTPLSAPGKNKLWMCPRPGLAPSLTGSTTPWVSGTTIDVSKIAFVPGSVTWQSEFNMTTTDTQRMLVGNGLPNHPTGEFPIPQDSAAYSYYAALPAQGYDNAAEIPIAPYDLNVTIPRDPVPNDQPSCVLWIFLGVVTQTGAAWHAEIAPDSQLKLHDPISALPLDDCWGHPYNTQYHYHAYSWKCFPDQGDPTQHSPLFGYAIDGFGVYGPRGEGGKLLTNDDLDECHGHTHEIEWDGQKKVMYHYHVNNEYPYSIGCFRGTPAQLPKQLQL
jgi:hypothetical protein